MELIRGSVISGGEPPLQNPENPSFFKIYLTKETRLFLCPLVAIYILTLIESRGCPISQEATPEKLPQTKSFLKLESDSELYCSSSQNWDDTDKVSANPGVSIIQPDIFTH